MYIQPRSFSDFKRVYTRHTDDFKVITLLLNLMFY